MKATITYPEISDYIAKNFNNICVKFATVDQTCVDVRFSPGSFLPDAGVKIRIESVANNMVRLSYDCNMAVSLMIAGATAYLESKIPNGIRVNTSDKRVSIDLRQIDMLEEVLKHVSLSGIAFDGNSVNVALSIAK